MAMIGPDGIAFHPLRDWCREQDMDSRQLDLFHPGGKPAPAAPSPQPARPEPDVTSLADRALVGALDDAGMAAFLRLAGEAARRRLTDAIPALAARCRRHAGYGAGRIEPVQQAAVTALADIGGREAARALSALLEAGFVAGPTRLDAVTAAGRLGVILSDALLLECLKSGDHRLRAAAAVCAGRAPGAIGALESLLDDLHADVVHGAACALGRRKKEVARKTLLRLIRAAPDPDVIDALIQVADADCVAILGQTGRRYPALKDRVLEALDGSDHPVAAKVAATLRSDVDKGTGGEACTTLDMDVVSGGGAVKATP
ncbi:MAG: hypothetical protein F8N37_19575 [Telmatospirillum sp.]|nr:hypothetical protein [Telmatospirillum sp.]